MGMLDIHGEMARHTAWADASVLAAVIGRPEAERDEELLGKLRHQHLVQRAFLDFWRGATIDPDLTRSLDVHALAAFAKAVHEDTARFHESVVEADLDRIVELPSKQLIAERLGFEPGDPTLEQTFLQVSSHSSYHRGQVCTRLRQLGIDPPMTDYIVWLWSHEPDASWSFLS